MKNKRGVFPILAIVAIAIGAALLAGITISSKLKWIVVGLIILVAFIWLLGQSMKSDVGFDKGRIIVLLIFLAAGLFFIMGSGYLQETVGGFVKPDWARLECAPTDSYEGVVTNVWLDEQTLFRCDGYTEECRFVLEHTGSGAFVRSLRTSYEVCDLNGNNCGSSRDIHLDDGQISPIFFIDSGRSIKFEVTGFGNIGEAYGMVTQEWRPWKLYRFVGGSKWIVNSVNCDVTSSARASIRTVDNVNQLHRTGGEGDKWINYVNDWNFGPATNIFNHPNYGQVYCTAAQVFEIVELQMADGGLVKIDPQYSETLPNGERLSGLGNRLANVECCPNEPSCNNNFEYDIIEEDECFSDIQCLNTGNPIPQSGTTYIIYNCVSGTCQQSNPITVECTTNAQCADGDICDLSTTNYGQCITQIIDDYCGDGVCQSNENAQLCPADCTSIEGKAECEQKAADQVLLGWVWVETTETQGCGFNPLCHMGITQPKVVDKSFCRASFLIYYILGGVILLLGIATIFILRKPGRKKKGRFKK